MKQKVPLIDILSRKYPQKDRNGCYSTIMCGEVKVNGECVRDPKRLVSTDVNILISEPKLASRAGYKLFYALQNFHESIAGKVVLDAGSSAGGFTDCLLRFGVRHVHSVDIAKGILKHHLRQDARTTIYENTNIMHLTNNDFNPKPNFSVCDLSFRSLRGAARRLCELTSEKWLIALIKPQFEFNKNTITNKFNGLLSNLDDMMLVISALDCDLRKEGVQIEKYLPAHIKGRKGNQEIIGLISLRGVNRFDKQKDYIDLKNLRSQLRKIM